MKAVKTDQEKLEELMGDEVDKTIQENIEVEPIDQYTLHWNKIKDFKELMRLFDVVEMYAYTNWSKIKSFKGFMRVLNDAGAWNLIDDNNKTLDKIREKFPRLPKKR